MDKMYLIKAIITFTIGSIGIFIFLKTLYEYDRFEDEFYDE